MTLGTGGPVLTLSWLGFDIAGGFQETVAGLEIPVCPRLGSFWVLRGPALGFFGPCGPTLGSTLTLLGLLL